MCFPVNFAEFLRKPFFTEHLWATASILFTSFPKILLTTERRLILWLFLVTNLFSILLNRGIKDETFKQSI